MANGEPPAHVVEIYKLCVEMADRVSARRATANSFFLTPQTGLAAALGVFAARFDEEGTELGSDPDILIAAAVSGIVMAIVWWVLLTNYRRLNQAKYNVINQIEKQHLAVTPYVDEWAELQPNDGESESEERALSRLWQRKDRYFALGLVEQVVPWAFVLLHLALIVYVCRR